MGLHHSQAPSIDQRKSLPFLYLNLWGCIVRANILFSQSFAHIYGSSQSYWCSPRILDAVKIYGFLDLLQKNIFSSPRHRFIFPTRNIFGTVWVIGLLIHVWYNNAPLTCVDSPCIAVCVVHWWYICVLGGGTMALH